MIIINEYLKDQKLQIYLDMDGVICDWDKQYLTYFKTTAEDIKKKYNEAMIWKLIAKAGIRFWTEMEWMPDAKKLWYFVKPYRPIILSSPARIKAAPKGKQLWVRRELGRDVLLILKQSRDKKELTNEKSILIDDREDNIKDWKRSGGISILHKSVKDTIYQLQKLGFK